MTYLEMDGTLKYDCHRLGTIQILRKQKGGWVGLAKCLRFLTRWVGGFGKMLT